MALQIRLSQDKRLGDLAKDLIRGFEFVLRQNGQAVVWGHRQKTKLIRTVRSQLAKAVRAYASCGCQPRCHLTQPPPSSKKVQRVLLLKQTLPLLTVQLEAAVFDRFYPGAADKIWLTMKPELDAVVESVVGPFLYDNPYCGACPLCTYETRLSPWSLKPTVGLRKRVVKTPDDYLSR